MERVDQALAWARTVLAGASDSGPDADLLDATLLLMHIMGVSRAALATHPEMPLTAEQAAEFRRRLDDLARGVPLAYVTGTRAFFDRDFRVTPAVLVPRPETEHLIEAAMEWARGRQRLRVVDVGTGSGAIAVTLAAKLPDARVWAVDMSADALKVARGNADRYGLGERITFWQGDLLEPLIKVEQQIDLIAANLPYIAADELQTLTVALYEPRLALDGGADGLDVIRRLIEQAPRVLAADGLMVLEIGAGQGERVRELAAAVFPAARVRVIHDYAGHDRVVTVNGGIG
ncbi:MAG TPA: peptide chain release factor N(5)-glutamine methyltransferase [Aggregatilineaceae bacterium]|nr:peptide chain release factor N(5)-glutamine methyltransferase [Aggregatilineaceae bacterium]